MSDDQTIETASAWLPAWLLEPSRTTALGGITLAACAIRLLLVNINYCMALDGPDYVFMAQQFASGHFLDALGGVKSPLYPWLIAQLYHVAPDFELAGKLVSLIAGTLTVPLLYFLVRDTFEREDLAIGAAALAAVHPQLAEYSAEVLTEATYIFLIIGALWPLVLAMKRRRMGYAFASGAIGGFAYLCRTEAIGVPVTAIAFVIAASLVWRNFGMRWALGAAVMLGIGFIVIASPYLLYLHSSTGHWTPGREFNTAWMLGAERGSARHPDVWHTGSPLADLKHVARRIGPSFFSFIDALEPLPAIALLVGLWTRGRVLLKNEAESLLAFFVGFHYLGFSFFNNDPRIMVHLIPFTFGWMMLGFESGSRGIARLSSRYTWRLPDGTLAGVIALSLLPQALWPIAYDKRGIAYAGREIARRGGHCVVAHEWRVAIYANAAFVWMPTLSGPDFCAWLETRPDADYCFLAADDARRLDDESLPCLRLIKRYPRKHADDYYDLLSITRDAPPY